MEETNRPTYKSKNDKALKKRLTGILNSKGYNGYDASRDSVYSDFTSGNLNRSKIAAQQTVDSANRNLGRNTYAQATAQAQRHSFDANNNAIVPKLSELDYEKQKSSRENQYAGMKVLQQNESTAYGRYRDKVKDWEFDRNADLKEAYIKKKQAEAAAAAAEKQAKADAKAAEKAAKEAAKAAKGKKGGSGGGSTSTVATTPTNTNSEWDFRNRPDFTYDYEARYKNSGNVFNKSGMNYRDSRFQNETKMSDQLYDRYYGQKNDEAATTRKTADENVKNNQDELKKVSSDIATTEKNIAAAEKNGDTAKENYNKALLEAQTRRKNRLDALISSDNKYIDDHKTISERKEDIKEKEDRIKQLDSLIEKQDNKLLEMNSRNESSGAGYYDKFNKAKSARDDFEGERLQLEYDLKEDKVKVEEQKYSRLTPDQMDQHIAKAKGEEKEILQQVKWNKQQDINNNIIKEDKTVKDILSTIPENGFGLSASWEFNQKEQQGAYGTKTYDAIKELDKAGYDGKSLVETYKRQRNEENYNTKIENAAAFAENHPALASGMSVGQNVVKGGAILNTLGRNAANAMGMEYKPVDYKDASYTIGAMSEAERGQVSSDIANSKAGEVGAFAYNVGMSMVDSLAQRYTLGPASTYILGAGAASDAARSAAERGLDDKSVAKTAIAAGAAEYLFETIELESLKQFKQEAVTGYKTYWKNVAKQAINEGFGEGMTDITNAFTDWIVNKDESELNSKVRSYLDQGFSYADAKEMVKNEWLKEFSQDVLAGAISGGISAGGEMSIRSRMQGAMLNNTNSAQALIESGLESNQNTESYKQALAAQQKIDNGQKLSNVELSNLQNANMNAINEETANNIANKLENAENGSENAEIITNAVAEGNISTSEAKTIMQSPQALSVLSEVSGIDLNSNSTVSQVKAAAEQAQGATIEDTSVDNSGVKAIGAKIASKTGEGTLAGVEFKNGNPTIVMNTADGSKQTVNLRSYVSTGNNNIDTLVRNISNYGESGAKGYIQGYDGSLTADEYTKGYNAFYQAGMVLLGKENVNSVYGNMLPISVRETAYQNGLNDAGQTIVDKANKVVKTPVADYGLTKTENTNLSETEEKMLESFAKTAGVDIIMSDDNNVNGLYSKGKIYISNTADNPAMVVLLHEYTHHLEDTAPAAYAAYRNEVIKFLKNSEKYDEIADDIRALYNKNNVKLTEEGLMNEVAANATEAFLSDPEGWQQTLSENKTFLQKLVDFISDFVEYLKTEFGGNNISDEGAKLISENEAALRKLQKLYTEAMNEANDKMSKDGDARYSIKTDENNNKYVNVDIDQEIFHGADKNKYRNIAKKYIRDNFVGNIYEFGSNEKALITAKTAREYTGKMPSNKKMKNAKLKAATELDNILKASSYSYHAEDDGTHPEAVGGWDYYDVIYKVGDRYWHGLVNIENTFYGRVFYDVTDISELKRDAAYGSNNSPYQSNASNENITKENNSVNNNEHKLSKRDSAGNKLSKGQQEYFADTKIVDKEGNLRVMYHGSSEKFTEFDPKKAKRSGTFGSGLYFSGSESHAGQYGNTYEVYLNSVNPLSSVNPTNKITEKQMKAFIQELADNEDYGLENYGYGATVDSVYDSVKDKDDFAAMMDLNLTAVGNMAEAVKLFNEINSTNIDGIDTPMETVVFEPNQVKLTDNENPTESKDMRFSLKKDANARYSLNKFEPTVEEKQAFVDAEDGLLRIVDAKNISNDMWQRLTKKFQKLGYGFEDWKATKNYYSKMLDEPSVKNMLLNKDMSDAVKEVLGIETLKTENEIDREKAKEYAEKAENTFGTTNRFELAGYLDVNGKLLDFSEGQGYRVQDHREISEILDLPDDADYSDGLIEFMNQGNIRLQSYGIDISVKPNGKQVDMLYKFFDNLDGEVTVDYSTPEGNSAWSADYKEGTSAKRILNDINKYFDTDERPQGTADGNIYYSLKKSDDNGVEDDAQADVKNYMADLLQQAVDTTVKFNPTDKQLDTMAKMYISKLNSDYDIQTFKNTIKNMAETLNNNQAAVAKDAVKVLQSMSMRILESSKELDYSMKEQYKDVADYLKKTNIKLTDKQKQEAAYRYGSYNEFRKKYFGKIKLSKEGISPDVALGELSEKYPELFTADITEGDAPFILADVLDVINTPTSTKLADVVGYGSLEQQSFQMASDMISKLMTTMNPTEANAVKQVNQLRSQFNEQLEAEKKKIKEEFFDKMKNISADLNMDIADPDTMIKIAQNYANITQHSKEMTEKRREQATRSKYKKDARKIADSLYKALTSPTESRYIPQELVNGVIDFCKQINFDTGFRKPDGQPTKAYEKLMAMRKSYEHLRHEDADTGMVTLMARMGDGSLKDTGATYDATIPQLIDQVAEMFADDKKINDLSTGELEDLVKGLSYIDQSVRNATKLKGKYKSKESYVMADSIIDDIKKSGGSKNIPINAYTNAVLSPKRFFRRLIGYRDNSEMMKLYNDLQKGEIDQHRYQQESEDIFKPVMEGRANEKMLQKITGKKAEWIDIGLKDADGKPVMITPAMKMSLYMHSLNKSNAEHAAGGGIKIPDMKLYKAGKIQEAYNKGTIVKIPENFIKNVEKQLTYYEKSFVKCAKEYFDGYSKELVNKTSMQLLGYEKARVKNYFPIRTDSNFNRSAFDTIAFDFSIANSGFLKTRQQGSKNPIMLEDITAVVKRQIDAVSKYAALAVPIDNFNKVFNVTLMDYENSVKNQIAKTWDQSSMKYIANLMADLNGARQSDKSLVSDALAKARGLMAQGVLTGNLSVTMKQAASYPTAAATVGWGPLAKAFSKGVINSKAKVELINKYTPEYRYRGAGNSTIELGDLAAQNSLLTKAGKVPVLGAFLNSIQNADIWTTGKLWDAAEYYVADNFNYKKGSDSYYRKTAEIYNDIIHDTQPNYAILNRPEILRSKSEAAKAFTMFMTQRLQNGNILIDSSLNLKAKAKEYKTNNSTENLNALKEARKEFANSVTSQIVAAMVIGGMTLLAKAAYHNMDRYRNDKNELDEESIWKRFVNDTLSSIAGSFLFGSEIYDFVSSILTGEKYYGISDNLFGNLEDAVDGFSKFVDVCKNEFMKGDEDAYDAESVIAATNKFVSTLCQAVGLPLSNVTNIGEGILLHYKDIQNGEFGKFEAGLIRKNTENTERLYEAFLEGNRSDVVKFYNAMVGAGKTEKQIESSLKKILEEKNQTIAAGAKSKFDGDIDSYVSAVNSLVNLGFERDTVKKAIDSYIDNNFEDKEEKEEPTKENYSYEDIMDQTSTGRLYDKDMMYQAVDNHDLNLAENIRQDAIDSEMKKNDLSYDDAEKKVMNSIKNGVKAEYSEKLYSLYSTGKKAEADKLKNSLMDIYGYKADGFKEWIPEGTKEKLVSDFMAGKYTDTKAAKVILNNYGFDEDDYTGWVVKEIKNQYIDAYNKNDTAKTKMLQEKAESLGRSYSTVLGWVGKKVSSDTTDNIESAIKTFSGGPGDYNTYINKMVAARDAEIARIMEETGKDEWDARSSYKRTLIDYFKKVYKDMSVEDRNRLQNILNNYCWFGKSRKKNTPYKYSKWLEADTSKEDDEETVKLNW